MVRQRHAKRKKVKGGSECCSEAPPSGLVFGLINFSWPCQAVASCREAFEKVASVAKKNVTRPARSMSLSQSPSLSHTFFLYILASNGRGLLESCTNKLQDKSQ